MHLVVVILSHTHILINEGFLNPSTSIYKPLCSCRMVNAYYLRYELSLNKRKTQDGAPVSTASSHSRGCDTYKESFLFLAVVDDYGDGQDSSDTLLPRMRVVNTYSQTMTISSQDLCVIAFCSRPIPVLPDSFCLICASEVLLRKR